MATSATHRFGRRAAALVVCAVGLYVVMPSLLTLFGAWPRLGDVRPWWFVIVVVLEAGSFASLWLLLRVALPGARRLDIATSQMAGNAASRVIPGGGAAGAVVQAHMLIRSGHPPATVGAALSATALLTSGVVLALPVLTLPTVLLGPPLAHQLAVGLAVSLVVAALVVGLGVAMLTWDGLVARLAGAVGRLVHSVRRRIDPKVVAAAVVAERDQVVAAFSGQWLRALASAAGNRLLDYSALLASLFAVGAQASPALVLVAYVAAIALAFVPITPGGLGFVEAGLTTLLVLGGVTAHQAILGTLLYRLASYWLPIPVGALAWAGWRVQPVRSSTPSEPDAFRPGRRSPGSR